MAFLSYLVSVIDQKEERVFYKPYSGRFVGQFHKTHV